MNKLKTEKCKSIYIEVKNPEIRKDRAKLWQFAGSLNDYLTNTFNKQGIHLQIRLEEVLLPRMIKLTFNTGTKKSLKIDGKIVDSGVVANSAIKSEVTQVRTVLPDYTAITSALNSAPKELKENTDVVLTKASMPKCMIVSPSYRY